MQNYFNCFSDSQNLYRKYQELVHNLLINFNQDEFRSQIMIFLTDVINQYDCQTTEQLYQFIKQFRNEMQQIFNNNNYIIAATYHLYQIFKLSTQQPQITDNFITQIAQHKQIKYCTFSEFKNKQNKIQDIFNDLFKESDQIEYTAEQLIKQGQNIVILSCDQCLYKFLEKISVQCQFWIYEPSFNRFKDKLQDKQLIKKFSNVDENQIIQKADFVFFEPELTSFTGNCLASSDILSSIQLANYYKKQVIAVTNNFFILQMDIQEQRQSPIVKYEQIIQQDSDVNVLNIKNIVIQPEMVSYYIINGELLKPNSIYIKLQNFKSQNREK